MADARCGGGELQYFEFEGRELLAMSLDRLSLA
jgi:hypothetical protein